MTELYSFSLHTGHWAWDNRTQRYILLYPAVFDSWEALRAAPCITGIDQDGYEYTVPEPPETHITETVR